MGAINQATFNFDVVIEQLLESLKITLQEALTFKSQLNNTLGK